MVKCFARTAISSCIAMLVAGLPISALAEPEADAERPDAYLLGVRLDLGMAFGGENYALPPLFIGVSSGFSAGLGVTFMPLWLHGHGLGLHLEAGYKYDGNQSTSMDRFPLLATIDVLLSIVDNVFIRLASGPEWHTGIQVVGAGMQDLEIDLPDAVGFLVEGGPAFRTKGPFQLDLAVRYTIMEYDATPDLDASNVSLHFAFQYVVL